MTSEQIAAALKTAKPDDKEHPLMKSFRLNGGMRQEDLTPIEVEADERDTSGD